MELELYKNLPGYALLTDEQKKIADRWDKERIFRDKYINMLTEAVDKQDNDLWKRALNALSSDDMTAFMCEHERHWSTNCSECADIERILRPELYCEKCQEELQLEEIEQRILICEYCRQEQNGSG